MTSVPHGGDLTPPPVADRARVVILTRTGCCLCDEAIAVAQRICEPLGVSVVLQDVDAAAELRERWNDHVPVTFVDGRRFDMWKLDGERLHHALSGEPVDQEPETPR